MQKPQLQSGKSEEESRGYVHSEKTYKTERPKARDKQRRERERERDRERQRELDKKEGPKNRGKIGSKRP